MNSELEQEIELLLGKEYNTLTAKEKKHSLALYDLQRKSISVAYICWFFSLHYLYVRKWLLFIVFFFTLGGVGLWWFIDLFRISTILKEYNTKIAHNVIQKTQSENG